jgi:hypothetical protein
MANKEQLLAYKHAEVAKIFPLYGSQPFKGQAPCEHCIRVCALPHCALCSQGEISSFLGSFQLHLLGMSALSREGIQNRRACAGSISLHI